MARGLGAQRAQEGPWYFKNSEKITFEGRPEVEEVSLWGRILSREKGQCKRELDKQGKQGKPVG